MKRILLLFLIIPALTYAVEKDSLLQIPNKFLDQVQRKTQRFEKRTDKRLTESLDLYLKNYRAMKDSVALIDPGKAARIFDGAIGKLEQYKTGLKNKSSILNNAIGNNYVDSVAGSLTFIKGVAGANDKKLNDALGDVQALKGKLQQSADIEKFISEHKEQLKVQLAQYTNLKTNLDAINAQYSYYHKQVQAYMELYRDPKKAEQKAFALLKQYPAYNDFIKRNSVIAGLFNLGPDYDPAQLMPGQQTRAMIDPLVQRAMGNSPAAGQLASARLQQGLSKLNEVKDGSTAADKARFARESLKTKTFLQRLEPGGNIQFQKTNQYYPSTVDIAAQLGYIITPKSSAGIGVSYTLGLGSGWEHFELSEKAFGLRSFLDCKVFGNLAVNGGFEANKIISNTTVTDYTKVWNGLQGSALVGISKQYQVNNKVKCKFILLYDCWPEQHIPQSRIKFRISYTR